MLSTKAAFLAQLSNKKIRPSGKSSEMPNGIYPVIELPTSKLAPMKKPLSFARPTMGARQIYNTVSGLAGTGIRGGATLDY